MLQFSFAPTHRRKHLIRSCRNVTRLLLLTRFLLLLHGTRGCCCSCKQSLVSSKRSCIVINCGASCIAITSCFALLPLLQLLLLLFAF
jgi:hypothetical protein